MPSVQALQEKKIVVSQIAETLKSAQAGVLVDYRGLTVEEDTQLRNALREANVTYFVAKNTLIRLAAKEIGLEGLDEILNGPTAIAISTEDPVAPAKIMSDFAKKNDTLELKSGFMEGHVMSLDEVKTLASTPSKETLIAKMMGSLNSPISSLVRLLNTIAEGGDEIADLIAKKTADAAPVEETPVVEEAKAEETPVAEATAEVAVEAPVEETEAPAAE